jgi:putative membrane protein
MKPLATWKINDKKARVLILSFSIIVFAAVVFLSQVKLHLNPGFDVHIFAAANAIINSMVTALLLIGLFSARRGRYFLHKKVMIAAMILSILFLVSYILHHLFAGETKFGDLNHDNILSQEEILEAGTMRYIYYFILATHIPLAAIILPFILFTAYRSLTGQFERHKRLARITWPIWFYVAVTGVIIYFLISPYY